MINNNSEIKKLISVFWLRIASSNVVKFGWRRNQINVPDFSVVEKNMSVVDVLIIFPTRAVAKA